LTPELEKRIEVLEEFKDQAEQKFRNLEREAQKVIRLKAYFN
jgi:hypothetical protein